MISSRWTAALVSMLVSISASPAPAVDRSKAVGLLPNHAMITIDGDVIDPASGGPGLKTAGGQAAAPTGSAFLLPALGLESAIDHRAEIAARLDDLFDNWTGSRRKYGTYLVLLPAKVDIKGAAKALLQEPSGTTLALRPYPLHDPDAAVHVVVPTSVADVDLFKAAPGRSDGGASVAAHGADAAFVQLDGFDKPVPVAVANLVEANFLNGFVTRLVLGSYVAFWETSTAMPHGAVAMSLGAMTPRPGALGLFARPETYPAGATLADDIAGVIAKDPINAMAIMWGWHAADELAAFDQTPDHRYIRDAWHLIGYRFSFRGVGDIVAFTINYLAGGAQSQRIRALVAGRDAPPVTDGAGIYAALTGSGTAPKAKEFGVGLQDVMFAELYAIVRNDNPAFDVEKKRILVTEYADFLTGYRKGESRAADALYREAGPLTFGLAYPTGILDGFSLGLSEALRDRHAADYAENWKQADVVVTSLQRQVAALEAKLRTASTSGGAGFWDRLGTMSDPRQSFIGAIAAFN